jgi:hypothetical protein
VREWRGSAGWAEVTLGQWRAGVKAWGVCGEREDCLLLLGNYIRLIVLKKLSCTQAVKMIPQNIISSALKQSTEDHLQSIGALKKLKVQDGSQFFEFFSQYFLPFTERFDAEDVLSLSQPSEQIYETTEWARGFDLPQSHIALTSGEGEGFYLYNIEDQKVYDVNLGQPWKDMIAGILPARWSSFYEFLSWYLELDE